MRSSRPLALRRRDFHVLVIVGSIAVLNVVSLSLCVLAIRHHVSVSRSELASVSASVDLSRSYCSSVVEYLALVQYQNEPSTPLKSDTAEEKDDDVVGVYGYGQTHSSTSTWIYRDDRLRDGRSRRVYLRRIPRQ